MEIRLIESAGVPASEIAAHQRIQMAFDAAPFTKGWRGYASFKLARGGPGAGDDDYDLVVVTHSHIIVIELKNWRGKQLVSRGGNWYVDGEPRGRSPVNLVNLKAKRLASALQTRVGPAKTPYVLSFVVMGEGLAEMNLDPAENDSVLYLDEMVDWTSEAEYRKFVTRPGRLNPLGFLNAYDLFFEGQKGRPAGFTLHGFRPENQPLWEHPTKLYAEFRAKEKADPDKLALLRQWNFGALGTELIGEGERGFIGLREQRVYEYVEPRNEELSRSLLRPVARASEAQVTRDFAELYVLPPKATRLSEFVNAGLSKLSSPERVVLVKAMLQRFADLHDLNVAHRDVGAHCLWIERPAKVVVSGFPAAYYPAMGTVGAFRDRVKVERTNLPEDLGRAADSTPFQRDVYMLGVLAHLLLFGERPPRVEGVYTWEDRPTDPFEGAFSAVLSKALSHQPADRYGHARDLLEALNAASMSEGEQLVDLAAFDAYKARTRARDYPVAGETLQDDDDLLAYRTTLNGEQLLVKEWHGVDPDLKRPDVTIRLLSFLERARNLRAASLPGLAIIRDYGLSRRSLLVVQEWVEGECLSQWMKGSHTHDEKLALSKALTKTLARLHDFEWAHGDVKPDNIVVRPNGESVFIDVLDYRRQATEVYSTAYLPADYKTMSPLARDRYSLAAVLQELLFSDEREGPPPGSAKVREEVQRLLTERSVSALEPLQSALEGRGSAPAGAEEAPIRVTVRNLAATGVPAGELVADNGFFYLAIEDSRKNPGSKLVHLTGAGARLTIEWNVSDRYVAWVTVRKVDLTQLMWAQDKCLGRIGVRLRIVDGVRNEASELEASLEAWVQDFADVASAPGERSPESIEAASGDTIAASESVPRSPRQATIDIRELWRALLTAEEDALPLATVTGEGRANPQRRHQLLLPCVLEGPGFDPEADDRTWVERCSPDGVWRRCGELELRDTSLGANAELAIERWTGRPAKPGDKLRLRSNMESASLNRRLSAVERLLEGRSVIPDLVEYFQTDGTQPEPTEFNVPAQEALDAYGQGAKRLNESQRDAFRQALQFGPVSLLQGPPGTGKTWFIASLLHYLVTREGARRILVVSQAHEAVNNALEKALELFESKGIAFDAVRLGHESVVSEPIRHLHSSSIEQVYRERFKAEYKERVTRLATEMGLPEAFAAAGVQLHVNVARLVEQIGLLEHEAAAEAARLKSRPLADEADGEAALPQRVRQLDETVRDICRRAYDFDIGELPLPAAVDELFELIAARHEVLSPQALDRFRRLLKVSDDWLKTLGEPAANFVEFLAKSRTVVAGTLVGIGRRAAGVVQNMYDWVIIDEAGRAAPSELAVALQTGRRILLVGDHKQLPPTFSQEVREAVSHKLGYAQDSRAFASDFERLFDSRYGKTVGTSLREQYRMAPAIGELVSEVFYEGKLATGRDASNLDTSLLPRQLEREVVWVDTSTLGKAGLEYTSPDRIDCWNEAEAEVVMGVLKSIVLNKALLKALREDLQPGHPIIGVICMYSRQRELLNRMKAEARWMPADVRRLVKVDTVDSYQGKENRIVILSTVRNNPQLNPGFLRSSNRINVAMSRAMERLVVVGATQMWRGKNTDLPLGRVLQKVEALAATGRASMVRAQEFRT